MHWLEHRIPPPIVFAIVAVAMWLASRVGYAVAIEPGVRITAAALLAGIGFLLAFAGIAAFRRARTTIDPHRPEAASSLVVAGVYRYTRNPMYLGLAVLLLAWALHLAAPVALAGPLLFAAFITRFQIMPEERVLARKFGADYAAYCRKVRRWL